MCLETGLIMEVRVNFCNFLLWLCLPRDLETRIKNFCNFLLWLCLPRDLVTCIKKSGSTLLTIGFVIQEKNDPKPS